MSVYVSCALDSKNVQWLKSRERHCLNLLCCYLIQQNVAPESEVGV